VTRLQREVISAGIATRIFVQTVGILCLSESRMDTLVCTHTAGAAAVRRRGFRVSFTIPLRSQDVEMEKIAHGLILSLGHSFPPCSEEGINLRLGMSTV